MNGRGPITERKRHQRVISTRRLLNNFISHSLILNPITLHCSTVMHRHTVTAHCKERASDIFTWNIKKIVIKSGTTFLKKLQPPYVLHLMFPHLSLLKKWPGQMYPLTGLTCSSWWLKSLEPPLLFLSEEIRGLYQEFLLKLNGVSEFHVRPWHKLQDQAQDWWNEGIGCHFLKALTCFLP